MHNVDFNGIHDQLLNENALPSGYIGIIADKAGFNAGGVRALLNGNTRVYVSDEAKRRVFQALIQILSEYSDNARIAAEQLKKLQVTPQGV
jgi:predicted Zn-dependent peptidase